MAANGHELPEWLGQLFTQVNLEDITQAMENITLADFTHLINIARGQELNADSVTKLYEEASKLSGAGTALISAALVIAVIAFCFPMAAAALLLTPLGFTMNNIAAGEFRAVCLGHRQLDNGQLAHEQLDYALEAVNQGHCTQKEVSGLLGEAL
ncbi:hypothetical protein KCU77_g9926, partial [Aureobasidium melanogenum]